jgi:hypothetical protein
VYKYLAVATLPSPSSDLRNQRLSEFDEGQLKNVWAVLGDTKVLALLMSLNELGSRLSLVPYDKRRR